MYYEDDIITNKKRLVFEVGDRLFFNAINKFATVIEVPSGSCTSTYRIQTDDGWIFSASRTTIFRDAEVVLSVVK